MVERVTLTPSQTDIVINNGATEGAVDLFSFDAEVEPAARSLGTLCVVGWRQADTNTMGYMISLIAALARREYYAQPDQAPRDAFARTLHKINDVVEEFGKSSDVQLAVGIWAIAGATVMTSRLDKFKLLLARQGEVIDIFNNVALFSKDYVQKRQFSSIIHGTLQDGDRLLAYWPSKQIIAKERSLKTWLVADTLKDSLEAFGKKNPTFSASFVHVDVQKKIEHAEVADIQPPELTPEPKVKAKASPAPLPVSTSAAHLAWSPRQHSGAHHEHTPAVASHHEVEQEEEIPQIIPAEFSRGTRSTSFSRFTGRLGHIRLDTRGKAVVLAVAALVIASAVVGVNQFWLVSPQEKALRAAVSEAQKKLDQAKTLISQHQTPEARTILANALTALAGQSGASSDSSAKTTSADIASTIDSLDSAQPATVTSVAQLDPTADNIALAVYSSTSSSVWAVTNSDAGTAVVQIADGNITTRATLTNIHPDHLLAYKEGVIVIDASTRSITRIIGPNTGKSYVMPIQEQILGGAVFADNLYLLTDKSILKVSGLDTPKPVTKAWLVDSSDLAAGAKAIWVDGNVYLLTDQGALVSYYKGKRLTSSQTTLDLSGTWSLIPGPSGTLAITNAERLRASLINLTDGSLVRTLKLDSQQSLVLMAEGPDGSILTVTKDNRIWKMQ